MLVPGLRYVGTGVETSAMCLWLHLFSPLRTSTSFNLQPMVVDQVGGRCERCRVRGLHYIHRRVGHSTPSSRRPSAGHAQCMCAAARCRNGTEPGCASRST